MSMEFNDPNDLDFYFSLGNAISVGTDIPKYQLQVGEGAAVEILRFKWHTNFFFKNVQ
jgi:hypothetical protein